MLNPKEIANALPLATEGPANSIKVGSIVTKGHIRVSRKPGLQVVTTPAPLSRPIAATNTDVETPAVAASNPIPGAADLGRLGDTRLPASPKPSVCDTSPADGPPMKLIKLIAAAAVSTLAAITLTFLQFSGPEKEPSGQRSASFLSSNPVIAAADARTLPTTATAMTSGSAGRDGADLVAQMTAGTLAVLRNGTPKNPEKTSQTSGQTPEQTTGMAEASGLYAMVLTALQQGQSPQYIDQLINEAHRANKVAVPTLLLTASGEVDTTALLTLFGKQ